MGKPSFTGSPAAAREYLAKRRPAVASDIEREARHIASLLEVSLATDADAVRRRGELHRQFREGIRAGEAFLPYLRWAPLALDWVTLSSLINALIGTWREFLPKRGRPRDARTHFAKYMLAFGRDLLVPEGIAPLTSDEICAAAIIVNLEVQPSERPKLREIFKKATAAGAKALAAEKLRNDRIARRILAAVPRPTRPGARPSPRPR